MWNKIYLAILAAAIVAAGVLVYLSYGWLQSVTAPRDVQTNFLYYANLGWMVVLISALILLVAANVVLWLTRRAWAMWATLLYFVVFTFALKFWLDRAFFAFQQTNSLTDSAFTFGAFSGALLIVMAAIIVFFNQYLVKRLHEKMYAPAAPPFEELPEESATNEKNS